MFFKGIFYLTNLKPGGPYTISVTFVGYLKQEKTDVQLSLGENSIHDFLLPANSGQLAEVTVAGRRTLPASGKGGTETMIGRDKMANLPTIGRQLQDFIRFVPQAKITAAAYEACATVTELLSEITNATIFTSKGEARRMITAGGVSVNKIKAEDPNQKPAYNLLHGRYLLAQKGKKNYFLIIID